MGALPGADGHCVGCWECLDPGTNTSITARRAPHGADIEAGSLDEEIPKASTTDQRRRVEFGRRPFPLRPWVSPVPGENAQGTATAP